MKNITKRASKAIAGLMTGLGLAVAQGLIIGRGAAIIGIAGAVLIGLGVYRAPANKPI